MKRRKLVLASDIPVVSSEVVIEERSSSDEYDEVGECRAGCWVAEWEKQIPDLQVYNESPKWGIDHGERVEGILSPSLEEFSKDEESRSDLSGFPDGNESLTSLSFAVNTSAAFRDTSMQEDEEEKGAGEVNAYDLKERQDTNEVVQSGGNVLEMAEEERRKRIEGRAMKKEEARGKLLVASLFVSQHLQR